MDQAGTIDKKILIFFIFTLKQEFYPKHKSLKNKFTYLSEKNLA